MTKTHIIIITVVSAAIIVGVMIGISMMNIPGKGSAIGVVEIEGIITSSDYAVEDIKAFTEDPGITAILLRVDSPGGGVAAFQEIYYQLKKASVVKTVVVSMGAVAASGGYYVALPAEVIVANPGTITGSIGVIMEFPVVDELLKKIGIDFEVIKSKEHKDIGSPYRKMTDTERRLLSDVVMDVYEQFVDVTARERDLPLDSVLKVADGRIFTGRQAMNYGLIDTLGSFEDAVLITGELIGTEYPQLVYPPRRLSLVDLFTAPMEQLFIPKLSYLWQ
jgi:protease-4